MLAGGIIALLAVGLVVAWPHLQVYAGSAPPTQFLTPLDPTPPPGHPPALGIAHNAGNNPETTATAIAHGADVVEIDVISVRGGLAAGRVQPWRWLADRAFRGPTLSQAWAAASSAPRIKLDLQENDRGLLDKLVAFLDERQAAGRVMISTRDGEALRYLRTRLPTATLIFTTAFPDAVQRIRQSPPLVAAVNGITAFQGLVDRTLVTWAHQNHLLVLAWTVNDGARLNQLLALGVDGVTTQNLAILQALARGP